MDKVSTVYGNNKMEYYMNRKGRYYFRSLDNKKKLIISGSNLKKIPGLGIKYNDVVVMDFETN